MDVGLLETALRVGIAVLVAGAIGLEREMSSQPAGLRTHTLMSLGACLFALAGTQIGGGDPARVAAQVASGVGFLGAGAILRESFRIRGLTTAASLWVTAAIGVAAGVGAYDALAAVALAALLVLVALRWIEASFLPTRRGQPLAVHVEPGTELPALLAAVQGVLGTVQVTRVQPLDGGAHRLVGDAHLPRRSNLVAIAEQVRQLPGVTAVDLTA